MEHKTIEYLFLSCFMLLSSALFAQDQDQAPSSFVDTRIVNGHSTEVNDEGVAKFIISHRFGRINSGFYDLFGLDDATIRIGLDYGLTKHLTIGAGRNSFEKTYDGYAKYQWISQGAIGKNTPVSLTSFHSVAVNGLRDPFPQPETEFTERMVFVNQLLLARRFSDDLSIQIMPTWVRRNLVIGDVAEHDILSIGAAFRYKLSQHWALSAEYYHDVLDRLDEGTFAPLALGIEIDTRGHVFQFQFGNAQGMVEKFFITETRGDILEGDIHFGFNITRDFKLKGRREG